MDIKKDRRRSNLWIINTDGSEHRPLTSGKHNDHSPRWSPDGKRLLYLSPTLEGGTPSNDCRWMDTGQTARSLLNCQRHLRPTRFGRRTANHRLRHAGLEPAKPFVQMPRSRKGPNGPSRQR